MLLFKQSLQRFFIGIARRFFPVITWGNKTFVFRDADIREILSRDEDFTIAEINGENIARHTGPFILGMDRGAAYEKDIAILRNAVKREDVENIRKFIRETAESQLAALAGEVDIVQEYTRLIPLRLLGYYFGTPGPDDQSMLRWNRTIFWDIFLDLAHKKEIRDAAMRSSSEMMQYLVTLIRERKNTIVNGGRVEDNMLNRLIRMQLDGTGFQSDEEIAGNIAGVFMGALEPTSIACVNVLSQFLMRGDVMKQALEAARNNDAARMNKLAMEAMRFQPNMPLLMRYSKNNQVIGGHGRRQRKIRAGKTLFLMTYSAMFDPRSVSQPRKFRADRPADTYLYYGYGLHRCFGNYINFVSLAEMLIALLRDKQVQPVSRKIVHEGPFPDHWSIRVS